MGTWRCPHCRTVQMEGPRCFLCNRSATSCGTCVNFRRAVVTTVGYCALDRQREPLSGEERRPCWSSASPDAVDGLFDAMPATTETPTPAPASTPVPASTPASTSRRPRLIELAPSPPAGGSRVVSGR